MKTKTNDWMTVSQCALLNDVSVTTIYRWIEEKKIQVKQIGKIKLVKK